MRPSSLAAAGRLLAQAARQAWDAARSPATSTLTQQQRSTFPSAAAYLQLAGIRTHGAHKRTAVKAHGRARGSTFSRLAAGVGKAVGLAAIGLPLAGIGTLVVQGRDDADAIEILNSLPRTWRVVWWGSWASYKYKALAGHHTGDPEGPAYQQALAELHQHAASKLLLVIQANGGIYIKAGQLAVSLNAVPVQYRTTLEALQDRVPPRPFQDANFVMIQELGAPADQLFAEFETLATAAASLAQVHKARMHDGTQVAVKVQYPGLQSAVAADVATLLILADAGHWLFPATSWRWMFEELQRQLRYELDFRNEATNAARLAECMAGRADVAVPRTMPQLCSPRVLTMEWVEGCRITDVECLVHQGMRPRDVGCLLLDTFAQQTYMDGFIHGDPHPGNLLVRPRPDPPPLLARLLLGSRPRPQLVLLDHGVYVTLPDHLRRLYCQLWCAIALGDMHTAQLAATELAGEKGGRILPQILRPRNWAKVSKEERQRFRQEAGVSTFADFAAVLTEAPKPLLDSLRQSAVVRHSATLLGATMADRLRMNATWALRGMLAKKPGQAAEEFVGALKYRLSRWRLALQVGVLRIAAWMAAVVQEATALVLPPLLAA